VRHLILPDACAARGACRGCARRLCALAPASCESITDARRATYSSTHCVTKRMCARGGGPVRMLPVWSLGRPGWQCAGTAMHYTAEQLRLRDGLAPVGSLVAVSAVAVSVLTDLRPPRWQACCAASCSHACHKRGALCSVQVDSNSVAALRRSAWWTAPQRCMKDWLCYRLYDSGRPERGRRAEISVSASVWPQLASARSPGERRGVRSTLDAHSRPLDLPAFPRARARALVSLYTYTDAPAGIAQHHCVRGNADTSGNVCRGIDPLDTTLMFDFPKRARRENSEDTLHIRAEATHTERPCRLSCAFSARQDANIVA
jgi:hypothetical protein